MIVFCWNFISELDHTLDDTQAKGFENRVFLESFDKMYVIIYHITNLHIYLYYFSDEDDTEATTDGDSVTKVCIMTLVV